MSKENPYLVQLRKKYVDFLRSVVRNETFSPIKLRGGTGKPGSTKELHDATAVFLEFEKKENRPGWQIEWEIWTSKKLGSQQWPSAIIVETEADYLYILELSEKVAFFKTTLSKLVEWRKEIRGWIEMRPQSIFDLPWEQICAVVDYILNNDLRNYYLRSIPVPVHTKFIERNAAVLLSLLRHFDSVRFPDEGLGLIKALGVKPKPVLYPVRWLDDTLARRYTSGITSLAVSSEDLNKLDLKVAEVWFVENDTNLYLLPKRSDAIALSCRGLALHVLSSIPFFQHSRLLYWGDLDEAGFRMLQQFRQFYPTVESILMDDETVQFHRHEIQSIPSKSNNAELQLQKHEMDAWKILRPLNGRIEQEKLDQFFVQAYLLGKGLSS
jgi:hypothetical protein